jgi:hypothetical protein
VLGNAFDGKRVVRPIQIATTFVEGNNPSGFDFRFIFAYAISAMDKQRENGALLIAACIVAAIRLRGELIQRSPKVMATISDSVHLARMGLVRLERE